MKVFTDVSKADNGVRRDMSLGLYDEDLKLDRGGVSEMVFLRDTLESKNKIYKTTRCASIAADVTGRTKDVSKSGCEGGKEGFRE